MSEEMIHRPTPEFTAHLEWEVRRAVRHDARSARRHTMRRAGWARAEADLAALRLQLEAMVAQARFNAAEAAEAEAERRVRVGAANEIVRLDAHADWARAREALAVVAKRLELRKEFIEKGTPVDQLIRRIDDLQLRMDADVAQQTLAAARERVAVVEKQRALGMVGDLELMKAQVDLKEHELEMQRLAQRLRDPGRPKPE